MLARRQFLTLTTQAPASRILFSCAGFARRVNALDQRSEPGAASLEERIVHVIEEYDNQGNHRTGTETDARSTRWLAHELEELGQSSLSALGVLILACVSYAVAIGVLMVSRCSIPASPPRTGWLVSSAAPAKTQISASSSPTKLPSEAARMARAGLAPINARHFAQPFGPPVRQVSSDEIEWLDDEGFVLS
jgi:hypothetical protein